MLRRGGTATSAATAEELLEDVKTSLEELGEELYTIASKACVGALVAMPGAARAAAAQAQVHRLLRKRAHFFPVLDSLLLDLVAGFEEGKNLYHKTTKRALVSASLHFLVCFGLAAPALLFGSRGSSWDTLVTQASCSLPMMVQNMCRMSDGEGGRVADRGASLAFLGVGTASLLYYYLYAVLEYTSKRIDLVAFMDTGQQGRQGQGPPRVTPFRRRLIRALRHPAFQTLFWTITVLDLWILFLLLSGFGLYLALAAFVAPARLVPVLLAVAGSVAVAQATFASLNENKAVLLAALGQSVGSAEELKALAEETLAEAGFNDTQILAIALCAATAFACWVAFVILGVYLFVDSSSVYSTTVSSLVVCYSTYATINEGKATSKAAQGTELTSKLTAKVQAKALVVNRRVAELAKISAAGDRGSPAEGPPPSKS